MQLVEAISYSCRWRPIHAGLKVLLVLGLLAEALLFPPRAAGPVVAAAAVAATLFAAGVPVGAYLRMAAVPAAMLAVLAIGLLPSIWKDQTGLHIAITPQSISLTVDAVLRAVGCLASLMLLICTTPLADLISLMRTCRVPGFMADLTALVYRLIWILNRSADDILAAQSARLGYSSPRRTLRSGAMLMRSLVTTSISRARRLEMGLAARAGHELKVLSPAGWWTPAAAAIFAMLLAATAAACWATAYFEWNSF